jgi:hypothetical protein
VIVSVETELPHSEDCLIGCREHGMETPSLLPDNTWWNYLDF